jgi:sporulation protein YlmC with PRC-barrel domain
MARNFRNSDKGKQVMTADGEMVGTVEDIEGEQAHIRPQANLSESVRDTLGWTDEGEDLYPIDNSSVASFSGNEIHLRSTL